MATQTSTLSIGTQIEGKHTYTIKRELGRGGFGLTYEATADYMDGNIRQTMRYCVKEFYPENVCTRQPDGPVTAAAGHEAEFKKMKKHFVTEASLMREVCHHRGIVSINEVFDYNGTSYYVMEYIDGHSLDSHIKAHGTMSESEALMVVNELGEALSLLHSKYINHLDVKPENVMLTTDVSGRLQPKLIDFGLSKSFRKNGTLASMINNNGVSEGYSPIEQYAGINRFSPQSDVYALAATLVYVLTGQHPCPASQMDASWLKLNLPANLSTETEYALIQALKPGTDRCQTVEAFIKLLPLEAIRARSAVYVDPNLSPKTKQVKNTESNTDQPKGHNNSRLWVFAALGILAIVLVALAILALRDQNPEDTAPDTADTEIIADEIASQEDTDVQEDIQDAQDATDDTPEIAETEPAHSAIPDKHQTSATQAIEPTSNAAQGKQETETAAKQDQAAGRLQLGYATYEGKIVKGVPHGRGKLTFHTSHTIEANDPQGRMAQEGDVVTGMFYDGHLTQGKITHMDGSTESIVIGS